MNTIEESTAIFITAYVPVTYDDGTFCCVALSDMTVSFVETFLRSLKIGQTGIAYIVERSGDMVANSVAGEYQCNLVS